MLQSPKLNNKLLSLKFCDDFVPVRLSLSRLLEFASHAPVANKFEIADATGIPTGEFSGKVEPMIGYASAMGLIESEKKAEMWSLLLTSAGKTIYKEDPYLNESITQWFLHLMLCRRAGLGLPATGYADAWFVFFGDWYSRLHNRFSLISYIDLLSEKYGKKGYLKGLAGIVVRTYTEQACLGQVKSFHLVGDDEIVRLPSPIDKTVFPCYAAYFYLLWDEMYPDQMQISLSEFLLQSRFMSIMHWDERDLEKFLEWLVTERHIQLDRQTGEALVLRLNTTESIVDTIYSELL